jgi:hypothetical protein
MLVILPSPHPGTLARPSTPKVLRAKERALTPYFSNVFTSDLHLSLLWSLGTCQKPLHLLWVIDCWVAIATSLASSQFSLLQFLNLLFSSFFLSLSDISSKQNFLFFLL